jgi:hypothetical protein
MIKPLVIAASGVLAGSAAWAGPYVNVENNGGYQDEYLGSTTDIHIGHEGASGPYAFYLQGGPSIVAPNGEDSETELSGKIGASVQASQNFSIYGELSFITAEDDPAIGTKLGAKYSF